MLPLLVLMLFIAARLTYGGKVIVINIAVLALSRSASAGVTGCILRKTTFLDQLSDPTPFYFPEYLVEADKRISKTGFLNQDGFRTNEKVESLVEALKAERGCKVVVLGDSFVWGDGLYPDVRWPSKLGKLTDCRVFPFGKNGWSTLEYLGFYERQLRSLEFDYLLISIVENDPHLRGRFASYNFLPDFMPQLQNRFDIASMLNATDYRSILEGSFAFRYANALFEGSGKFIAPRRRIGNRSTDPPHTATPSGLSVCTRKTSARYGNPPCGFWAVANHKYGFLLTPHDLSGNRPSFWSQIAKTMTDNNFSLRECISRRHQAVWRKGPAERILGQSGQRASRKCDDHGLRRQSVAVA